MVSVYKRSNNDLTVTFALEVQYSSCNTIDVNNNLFTTVLLPEFSIKHAIHFVTVNTFIGVQK